jgi:hypothetical protein
MGRRSLALIFVGGMVLVGCGGASQCAGPWSGSNLPSSVCSVSCTSSTTSSDVMVQIAQTAPRSGGFIAHVKQTQPVATDMTFTSVSAAWSGDFFNFIDTSSQLPLKFHLLTRGAGAADLNNVEIYTNDSDLTGGPVNVGALNCTMQGN